MNRVLSVAFAVLALASFGDDLRGAGDIHVVESSNVLERAWSRSLVSVTPDGELKGDRGIVGSAAADAAVGVVAGEIATLADDAKAAATNTMSGVYALTNDMARSAFHVTFHIAPGATDDLVGYVVDTTTTGSVDTQYVWYSQELSMPPARYVTYESYDQKDTIAVEWTKPFSNTVSRTVGGVTWTGCHVCTVQRPSFAIGHPCVDHSPYDAWGGQNGFDFGSMPVFVDGVPAITRVVTNELDSTKWVRIENGFIKEGTP